jgi:hypothetical protein
MYEEEDKFIYNKEVKGNILQHVTFDDSAPKA